MRTIRNLIQVVVQGAMLVTLSATVQAQLTFSTYDGAVTITGYTGTAVTLNIPDTTNGCPVTSIADSAFSFCTSITNIIIPSTVTYIGQRALYACFSLKQINVEAGNPAFTSVNGVLFSQDRTTLIEYPSGLEGSYTIPDGVTNIGLEAFFSCDSMTSVTIPNSITSIGESAFGGCLALTNVTLPHSASSIGPGTFATCKNLENVVIPSGFTFIGDEMFEGSALKTITIPNTVTNIGDSSFCGCPNLISVTIPSSVTGIKELAFESCWNLKSIYFEGNAPSAGMAVFAGDTMTVYYLPGTFGWENFAQLTGATTVLWNPQAQTNDGRFGIHTNNFCFNIIGTANIPIVVEACTNLNGAWEPLQSASLTNGSFYFSDLQWTNYPGRFYRLRSP